MYKSTQNKGELGFRFGTESRIYLLSPSTVCLNNQYLFCTVEAFFRLNNYPLASGIEDSDIVVVNTCGYTDNVMREHLERIAKLNQRKQVIVFGCLSRLAQELQSDREIILIGPKESHKFSVIFEHEIACEDIISSQCTRLPYNAEIDEPSHGFVQISQGCSNHCSYCNIKLAKGNVKSKPIAIVENEVANLIHKLRFNITLLADDCGSYGHDIGTDMVELMTRLRTMDDRLKIKIYTIFPGLFLKYYQGLEPYFLDDFVTFACVPVQSGSGRILDLMNRNYNLEEVKAAVSKIKSLSATAHLFTHFIVNFPTETIDDFRKSLEIARIFDFCFFLAYGENARTPAAQITPKCKDTDLDAKIAILKQAIESQSVKGTFVGQRDVSFHEWPKWG